MSLSLRMPHVFRSLSLALLLGFVAACGGDGGTGVDDDGPNGDDQEEPAEKPSVLPTFASLDLYSDDSPLNTPIPANPAVDPDSDGYIAVLDSVVQAGGFAIELGQYTTTVFFADGDTPDVTVPLHCGQEYAGVDALSGVPIPDFAEPTRDVDGSSNPIRDGECGSEADQDNQMVVVDLAARCEYDFFQMRLENGTWAASWGNSISLDSRGIYEHGLSARGSGFTQLAGQIWPDELAGGRIRHALIFSYPLASSGGPVAPATETDGPSDREFALPEGARLQLDPSLDLDDLGLTGYERTIARALQEYGMFLVDINDTGISIEAIDPESVQGNPYQGLLPDGDYPSLPNIPTDRLRVLELGPQNPNANEDNMLVDSGCGSFR